MKAKKNSDLQTPRLFKIANQTQILRIQIQEK